MANWLFWIYKVWQIDSLDLQGMDWLFWTYMVWQTDSFGYIVQCTLYNVQGMANRPNFLSRAKAAEPPVSCRRQQQRLYRRQAKPRDRRCWGGGSRGSPTTCFRYRNSVSGSIIVIHCYNQSQALVGWLVGLNQRRKIKIEAKAKVIAADWGKYVFNSLPR